MAIIIVPAMFDGATAASVAEHLRDPGANTTIDFSRTRLVTLEAVAALLAICAKASPETITWRFTTHRDIDDLYAAATLTAPNLTEKLRKDISRLERSLRTHQLRKGTFETALQNLRKAANTHPRVLRWVNARISGLEVAPLVGYFFRIGAFAVARELKINVSPDATELPQIQYDTATDTGTIPFTPLHTMGERRSAMGRLADVDELSRIFGKYAGVEFVRGGALAEIVIAELGSNVVRHACCAHAWLSGRVVPQVFAADPLLRSFLDNTTPLFEMLVTDDGRGIEQTLGEHFRTDDRSIINEAYGSARDDISDVLAYAFERFSSSKSASVDRWDSTTLDHRDDTASGLYWIWNFVRAKGGTLGIASGGRFVWWDFTTASARTFPRAQSEARFCIGTTIRIVLPLHDAVPAAAEPIIDVDRDTSSGTWQYASLDDLNIPDLVAEEGTPSQRDKIWSQLHHLGRNVRRNGVLVVDVGSLPRLWVKDAAYPLIQWAVEANVTGPSGDVAVLLVSLPDSSASVFELAARDALAFPTAIAPIRRAVMLVFESGRARAVASSQSLEIALSRLYREGTLTISDLAAHNADTESLRTALRDNAHIVREVAPDTFTLRVWYLDLVEFLRREHLRWLEYQIDHSPAEGGILLGGEHDTLFRLPATGRLSRVFFHFRSLFSNRTALYRLTWLFSDAIDQLEQTGNFEVDALVSVTRPPVALVEHLVAFRERKNGRRIPALMASTLEELTQTWYAQNRQRYDHAILVQSVINSGATTERVATALPIGWAATIVCADTRVPADKRDHLGGELVALVDRAVMTLSPVGVSLNTRIVAIDEVSISPVLENLAEESDTVAIWSYLENASDALRVGHHEEVNYHHYVYYVDTAQLLTAADSEDGTSLMERIVAAVVTSVGAKASDELVILHPPAAISEGERMAVALQHATGARFRHVVYRDSIAGQWRFSPYADLGLPLSDATVIVVDDGSNTGDTLMGLIAAALSGPRPASLVVAVAVSRLPAHRAILFQNLRNVGGVSVSAVFFCRLEMPVYAAPACPVCRYMKALSEVPAIAPALGPAVNGLRDALKAQRDATPVHFLFEYSEVLAVGRLRESIERVSYDSGALLQLTEKLEALGDDGEYEATLDFAFVAASEPDVLRASVLAPYYYKMLDAFVGRIENCESRELPTYVAAVARAITRVVPPSKDDALDLIVRRVWFAALQRSDMTPRDVAVILALVLAEATEGSYGDTLPKLANLWISELAAAADRTGEDRTLVHAFALLYARDAARTKRFVQADTALIVASAPEFLFDLATDVAANFWAHASENIRALVELIRAAATGRATTSIDDAASKIASKLTNLLELKSTLQAIDAENIEQSGDTTGALVAWGDEVDRALTEMVIGLVDVTRPLSNAIAKLDAELAAEALVGRWHKLRAVLDPVFMELFPDLREVSAAWVDSTASLPPALVGPVQSVFGQYDRVFIPRPLLQRFIRDAVDNCLKYAFPGDLRNDPRARIEASLSTVTSEEGESHVMLEIVDTGPTLGVQKYVAGHGFGLKHLRRLVPPFGGLVQGPVSDDKSTVIQLTMLRKEKAPSVPT